MRPLSATEAFTPAIERTKAMLLPFSLRLSLKLGLIALLAEMSAQFFFPPVGNFNSHPAHATPGISAVAGGITPLMITVFVAMGCIFFLLGLAFLYFGSRMQFVLMDLVATRSSLAGPSWRKHGPQTWRWIGLKLLSCITILAIVGAVIALPLIHLIRSIPNNDGQPPNAAFFGSFILIFATVAVAILTAIIVIWTLRDLVLPFIVFDEESVSDAVRSVLKLIQREPTNVLFYFLMKLVLSFAAAIAAELCIFIAALVAAIPVGLIGGGLWMALHHSGPFGTAFLYVSLAMLGLAFLAFMLLTVICVVGAVLIFYQAYALYFLGGRIPALGNLLVPPPPPLIEETTLPLAPA